MTLSKKFHEILTKINNYYQSRRVTFFEQWIEVNMNSRGQDFIG